MSQIARLGKLWPHLSAKERGILVLRSLKTGEREDYRLRSTMPPAQVREFNHYIALMNGGNLDASVLLLLLREILLRLQTLAHVIRITQLWAISNRRVRLFLDSLTVPITASGYERERGRTANEVLTFEEATELVAVGSLKDGPGSDWCPLTKSEETEQAERKSTDLTGEAVAAVRGQLVALWAEASTVEAVFTEVGEEFEGEDPAHSKVRVLLEEVLQGCRELAEKNQVCLGKVEPPEPTRRRRTPSGSWSTSGPRSTCRSEGGHGDQGTDRQIGERGRRSRAAPAHPGAGGPSRGSTPGF